ncbi:MAG: hypothetical protein LKCHEGNO_00071 [Burkholderiaceae bacterium]|nr:hypothetical protein [Burkholderiaceae bacterium]
MAGLVAGECAVTSVGTIAPVPVGLPARAAALSALALGAASHFAAGPRLSILIFHRILAKPDPLLPGEIDAARFRRLMMLVRKGFRVLPLDQASRQLAERRLPPRSLSITFDDGYADNHDLAVPILRELGLPSTIFVATGFLDGGRMWNDSVIECIRRTERTEVDLGFMGLPLLRVDRLTERRSAIERVLPAIKHCHPRERDRFIAELHRACGQPRLPSDLMMTRAQVRSLARTGFAIGAHTVNHPILQTIDAAEAEREIADGRAELERVVAQPVSLFAYPNGRRDRDFGRLHVDLVRRLGFAAAVSTEPGSNEPEVDLFELRRFSPWDTSDARWIGRLAWSHARKRRPRSRQAGYDL